MGQGLSHTRARLLADESGFTLIELMLVTVILTVILGATLALADTSSKLAPKDQERGHVIQDAQVGLHRMSRELRQAYALGTANATSIQVDVLTAAGPEKVTYDCGVAHPGDPTVKRCERVGASGRREVVVDRIKSATFTYEGTPTNFARIKLVVPARGALREGHAHDIVLSGGFYMRNLDV